MHASTATGWTDLEIDSRESFEQLQADGATVMQEYQPFPTYDGFVMADPEGRWIEIMEYTHDTFRVQEFTSQRAGECGLRMIGFVELVRDLDAIPVVEAPDSSRLLGLVTRADLMESYQTYLMLNP